VLELLPLFWIVVVDKDPNDGGGRQDVIYVHDASESAGLLSPNSLKWVSMIYYEETLGVCNTGEAVESHSTAELSESQVICSTILPLPLLRRSGGSPLW
jgi:hypothetical protein